MKTSNQKSLTEATLIIKRAKTAASSHRTSNPHRKCPKADDKFTANPNPFYNKTPHHHNKNFQ